MTKLATRVFAAALVGLTALSATQVTAQTFDLLTLYQSSLDFDADIAAAEAAYRAEQEAEGIALAPLLPNLSASAAQGQTNSNIHKGLQNSDFFKDGGLSVNLSQSLFDLPNWYELDTSEANSAQAEAIYLEAQQDLILNVSTAYFNVLSAESDLTAAKALETAVKRQYQQAKEQFDVGLIAITDVHEAKASFDSSKTTRIRAEGALTLSHETLARITGIYTENLFELDEDFPIIADPSNTADSWVEIAEENSLAIKAAQYAYQSVESTHSASKAEHWPTLTLNAAYENRDFDNYKSGVNGQTETETSNVFLNFNLPIYSGGGTQANVRRTRFQLEQARQQLESTKRLARLETRTEFINITTNIQTVESLQQNIISRESALEATREGYNVGTRNIVEVLDAERNYFTALRDYAAARFDFVESTLRIRKAAGLLSLPDIEALNAYLVLPQPETEQTTTEQY